MISDSEDSKKRSANSTRLVISAVATVGALLLVALMCFWGCFLYKKFGKADGKGLVMDVKEGLHFFFKVILNASLVYLNPIFGQVNELLFYNLQEHLL